jgi:hypothetical protein
MRLQTALDWPDWRCRWLRAKDRRSKRRQAQSVDGLYLVPGTVRTGISISNVLLSDLRPIAYWEVEGSGVEREKGEDGR